ncbi:MAG: nucleotidyltransferase domain-containing protein [Phycisphaerales bacterium]|nr:nucleotidyltransferase domain-containing protein [Phycisphaerales bacterium]
MDQIRAFCERWGVREFSLFGSVVRGDFRATGTRPSDVDVMLSFLPGRGIDFDNRPDIYDELGRIFAPFRVDVVERELILNPFRLAHMMASREVLYAA